MVYAYDTQGNPHMAVSTERATAPESTTFKKSNFSVQIQIKPKSQFEFVPQATEKSEFLESVHFGDVAFSVETFT